MNLKNGQYLIDIYKQCKDFKIFFLEEDYHKIIEALYHILESILSIDNMYCALNDCNQNSYQSLSVSVKTINKDLSDNYIHTFNDSKIIMNDIIEEAYVFFVPLYKNKDVLGFFAFIRESKDWDHNEKEFLSIFVEIYAYIFSNKNEYQKLLFKESTLIKLLDSINGNIYITDPKTDEILFMNKLMKKAFNLGEPIGQKCWSYFFPQATKRCDNCPIHYLNDHPDDYYVWENSKTYNHHVYLNQDCMIEWLDHRLVHFQHSIDITEMRKMQIDAFYDELTGIFNRKAGKSALNKLLDKAHSENKNVIVCLYDLDNLKLTNDSLGHHKGDYMLKTIANTVQAVLLENDVFFRLSGDEFVIGFYDISYDAVNKKMLSALKKLKNISEEKHLKYPLSFCYGLYEVMPKCKLSLGEIIVQADEKMYVLKKKKHLNKASLQLRNQSPIAAEFDYNKDLLYDALVKSTDDYIFICNMKTGVFKYTPAMVDEFNFPSEILTNAAAVFGSKIHKDDKSEFLNSNQMITDGRSDSHIVEYRALNKNNEWVWLRCRGHVEYDQNGEMSIFAGFISNLGKKNYRDILTSLYNKFEFEKRVNESSGRFAVIVLNINGFKTINQLYDREFGDNVLRIIAQNLHSMFHKEATIFKLDGDEFALLLKETDLQYINTLFQKIQSYAMNTHVYENKTFTCSFTAGAALAPIDGRNYLELRKSCEIALQYGKRHKRNHLVYFRPALLEEETFTLQILTSLQQDIHNNYEHFYLVYQPKVTSCNHQLKGFEALCRWQHPSFPHIGPDIFIPLLENSYDIVKLGQWIFEQSLIQLKSCLYYNPYLSMSINVSYIQLIEKDFVSFVKSRIEYYHIPFQNIIIELTETAIAKNTQLIIQRIQELKHLGIHIAMDDFGTGYSSLSLLKDEPLDIIKVDQSFVRNIKNDSFNCAFMKLIIELCHEINLKVVIEGVETQEELHVIEQFKPDYIQGFYTGRPMDKDQCMTFVQESIDNYHKLL